MSKLEHNEQNIIDDSEDHVHIDTSEFRQIVKRLDKIDGDIENITSAIKDGDDSVRQYVDKRTAQVRQEMSDDVKKLAENFKFEVRTIVSELLSPISNHVSQFMERANNNLEEIKEVKASITETKRQHDTLSKQFAFELETRLSENASIMFALMGDGKTSEGVVGMLKAIKGDLNKMTEQVEQHDKIFQFIKGINWRFVLAGVGILSPSIVTALEVLGII